MKEAEVQKAADLIRQRTELTQIRKEMCARSGTTLALMVINNGERSNDTALISHRRGIGLIDCALAWISEELAQMGVGAE